MCIWLKSKCSFKRSDFPLRLPQWVDEHCGADILWGLTYSFWFHYPIREVRLILRDSHCKPKCMELRFHHCLLSGWPLGSCFLSLKWKWERLGLKGSLVFFLSDFFFFLNRMVILIKTNCATRKGHCGRSCWYCCLQATRVQPWISLSAFLAPFSE